MPAAVLELGAFVAHLRALRGRPAAVLGVDLGTRKTGFAVCADALGGGAVIGLGVARAPPDAADAIAHLAAVASKLAAAHGAVGVVVGWPLDPRGVPGDGCRAAEDLAAELHRQQLEAALLLAGGGSGIAQCTATPVLLLDERGSSTDARAVLHSTLRGAGAGVSRRAPAPARVRARVDEAAAVVILERLVQILR